MSEREPAAADRTARAGEEGTVVAGERAPERALARDAGGRHTDSVDYSDDNATLDKGHVVNVVSNGQGPMPSFSWMGEEDINLIAGYIVQVKK